MPIYHFNVFHDQRYIDFDGVELPNMDAAWLRATSSAGETLKNMEGKLKPGHDWKMEIWKMEITDEFLNPLMEVQIKAKRPTN